MKTATKPVDQTGAPWYNEGGGGSIQTLTTTIGDGVQTEITITHDFSSLDLIVEGRMDVIPYEKIELNWDHRGEDPTNTVTILFSEAPETDSIVLSITKCGDITGGYSSVSTVQLTLPALTSHSIINIPWGSGRNFRINTVGFDITSATETSPPLSGNVFTGTLEIVNSGGTDSTIDLSGLAYGPGNPLIVGPGYSDLLLIWSTGT